MRAEMDQEEDSNDEMWADEDAAAQTAHLSTQHLNLTSWDRELDDCDSEGEEGSELDIAEATKHLGDEQGAAVGKILDKDRKGWLRSGKSKKNTEKGLFLWEDSGSDDESVMGDDDDIPPLPFNGDELEADRVLTLIQAAVSGGGACQS